MRFNAMLSPLKNSAIWSAIILVAWEIDRLQDRLIGSMAHGFLATLPLPLTLRLVDEPAKHVSCKINLLD